MGANSISLLNAVLYPNPFYDELSITFNCNCKNNKVTIKIVSMYGNTVQTLIDNKDYPEGIQTLVQPVNFNDGVYVIQCIINDSYFSKTILKIN
jgi:hypothetical protein